MKFHQKHSLKTIVVVVIVPISLSRKVQYNFHHHLSAFFKKKNIFITLSLFLPLLSLSLFMVRYISIARSHLSFLYFWMRQNLITKIKLHMNNISIWMLILYSHDDNVIDVFLMLMPFASLFWLPALWI